MHNFCFLLLFVLALMKTTRKIIQFFFAMLLPTKIYMKWEPMCELFNAIILNPNESSEPAEGNVRQGDPNPTSPE